MLISLKFYQCIPSEKADNLLKLISDNYEIRSSFNGAILDLSHIVSTFHIEVACAQAILKYKSKRMKTKCLWDEIQYSASGTSRIDEALKTFQVNSNSKSVAVIILDRSALKRDNDTESQLVDTATISSFISKINNVLQDHEISVDSFNETTANLISSKGKDFMDFMLKQFKLNTLEIETFGMENVVITRIATKGAL